MWNTIESVTKASGEPVISQTGHAFIKQRMQEVNALYGGEMSAHHSFRDFAYCDEHDPLAIDLGTPVDIWEITANVVRGCARALSLKCEMNFMFRT